MVANLRGIKGGAADARVREFLGLFGILEARNQRLVEYSKGMRQKVLISAALIANPEVLFLDEPLNGLDANAALVVKELLRELASQGRTILFCSHILEVVERICTRIVIIDEGSVVSEGRPEEIAAATGESSLEAAFARITACATRPMSRATCCRRWARHRRTHQADHDPRTGNPGAGRRPRPVARAGPGDAAERLPGRQRATAGHGTEEERQLEGVADHSALRTPRLLGRHDGVFRARPVPERNHCVDRRGVNGRHGNARRLSNRCGCAGRLPDTGAATRILDHLLRREGRQCAGVHGSHRRSRGRGPPPWAWARGTGRWRRSAGCRRWLERSCGQRSR